MNVETCKERGATYVAASCACRSLPNWTRSSCVISLATLCRLGTMHGHQQTRQIHGRVIVDRRGEWCAEKAHWCVIFFVDARSFSRACGWVGHDNGAFCWSRRVVKIHRHVDMVSKRIPRLPAYKKQLEWASFTAVGTRNILPFWYKYRDYESGLISST